MIASMDDDDDEIKKLKYLLVGVGLFLICGWFAVKHPG